MGLLTRAYRGSALALLTLCGGWQGQEPEYTVKGAFMYKFGDYVEWPSSVFSGPGAPFAIGILGEDPFDGELDQTVQNRTVHGRPIVVRRFRKVDQVHDVQVLFMSPSEAGRWEQDLAGLQGLNILTIGDRPSLPGAVITFVLQGNRVRFEIDQDAADRAGLKLSSKLLSLATSVKRKG